MASNLDRMSTARQRKVIDLYQSSDSRDQDSAKTQLVDLPAMPDERVPKLQEIKKNLGQLSRVYPDDPCNAELIRVRDSLGRVIVRIEDKHRQRIKAAGKVT